MLEKFYKAVKKELSNLNWLLLLLGTVIAYVVLVLLQRSFLEIIFVFAITTTIATALYLLCRLVKKAKHKD